MKSEHRVADCVEDVRLPIYTPDKRSFFDEIIILHIYLSSARNDRSWKCFRYDFHDRSDLDADSRELVGSFASGLRYHRICCVLSPDFALSLTDPDLTALGNKVCHISAFEVAESEPQQDGQSRPRIQGSKAEHQLPCWRCVNVAKSFASGLAHEPLQLPSSAWYRNSSHRLLCKQSHWSSPSTRLDVQPSESSPRACFLRAFQVTMLNLDFVRSDHGPGCVDVACG